MGFFGISEPAIYGITLKYRKAFACAVIGGGIGGAIAGSCGARAMAVAVAAVPTFPAYWIYHCLLWSILNFSCLNLFCRI